MSSGDSPQQHAEVLPRCKHRFLRIEPATAKLHQNRTTPAPRQPSSAQTWTTHHHSISRTLRQMQVEALSTRSEVLVEGLWNDAASNCPCRNS